MSSTARLSAARAGAVLPVLLLSVLLSAGPALATRNPLAPQEGADRGAGIGVGTSLLLYGVLPLVILVAVAAVAWLPGMARSRKYRPNRGWSAAPVWFAGPADPVAAVETAQVGSSVRGGASGDW